MVRKLSRMFKLGHRLVGQPIVNCALMNANNLADSVLRFMMLSHELCQTLGKYQVFTSKLLTKSLQHGNLLLL